MEIPQILTPNKYTLNMAACMRFVMHDIYVLQSPGLLSVRSRNQNHNVTVVPSFDIKKTSIPVACISCTVHNFQFRFGIRWICTWVASSHFQRVLAVIEFWLYTEML
mmetsp:Transcript_34866/g.82718  ORF Transcript_34866/g.82718 Transcript_34866/m.82718 type:complete len:107 (+) Transcript_34866:528-848(+)